MSNRNAPWTAANILSQQGRRVLITGANSGIGFHAALELARHGAEIILPARTPEKAQSAVDRIRAEVPAAILHPEILDLADQTSIRAFAARVLARFPAPSLDLLINNAGVMALPKREVTPDGFERQFATNYLGPFTLTALLFPALKPVSGSRIVTISSAVSKSAKIDFENLQGERRYSAMSQAYAQSKLADLIFTVELQRRLTAARSPIVSTAAHPGYAVTNLQADHLSPGLKLAIALVKPFLSQDAARGALPTLYAAVAPQALPRRLLRPRRRIRDERPSHPRPHPQSRPGPANRLSPLVRIRTPHRHHLPAPSSVTPRYKAVPVILSAAGHSLIVIRGSRKTRGRSTPPAQTGTPNPHPPTADSSSPTHC